MTTARHVLIRSGRIEADDYFVLADDAPLPVSGKLIVSLDRWRREREVLLAALASVGVKLPNVVDVAAAWPEIEDRPLIALDFPGFADGRAYSQARLLSERFRYAGELRATGKAVVRDQFHFMVRCGFSSFELRDDQHAEACLQALRDFSIGYQHAADDTSPVFARRRAQAI